MNAVETTLQRLEDQIKWYDTHSLSSQYWYKGLKLLVLVTAALIPLLSGLDVSAYIVGGAGASVVIIEGAQQLFQFQRNWTAYRSSCETLKHEKYLFLASASYYADSGHPLALLAERIESIISKEHTKWASTQEKAAKKQDPPESTK